MKTKKTVLLMSLALLTACALLATTVVYAVWQAGIRSQENKIYIGENTRTINLSDPADPGAELYPGIPVSVEYVVSLSGDAIDNVTVAASVDQPNDFDIAITNLDGGAAVTTVTNEMTIVVTVTFKSSVTERPTGYEFITLTVTLTASQP